MYCKSTTKHMQVIPGSVGPWQGRWREGLASSPLPGRSVTCVPQLQQPNIAGQEAELCMEASHQFCKEERAMSSLLPCFEE